MVRPYGDATVFFSRMLPVVRSFVSESRRDRGDAARPLHGADFAGTIPWCFGLAAVGLALGSRGSESHGLRYADYAIIALVVAGVVGLAYRHRRRSTRAAMEERSAGGTRPVESPSVPIPHVDVKARYARSSTSSGRASTPYLESGSFILGPEVRAFEEEAASFSRRREAVGVANGRTRSSWCSRRWGSGPATRSSARPSRSTRRPSRSSRVGATPFFCEIEPGSLNLDPAESPGRVTRADEGDPRRSPLRPAGRSANFPPDPGDRGRRAGVRRDVGGARPAPGRRGHVQLLPDKNLFGLGDGGLVVSNDPWLADRVWLLRFHGSRDKERFDAIGMNSRLDEIQAAALRLFSDTWTSGTPPAVHRTPTASSSAAVPASRRSWWKSGRLRAIVRAGVARR